MSSGAYNCVRATPGLSQNESLSVTGVAHSSSAECVARSCETIRFSAHWGVPKKMLGDPFQATVSIERNSGTGLPSACCTDCIGSATVRVDRSLWKRKWSWSMLHGKHRWGDGVHRRLRLCGRGGVCGSIAVRRSAGRSIDVSYRLDRTPTLAQACQIT